MAPPPQGLYRSKGFVRLSPTRGNTWRTIWEGVSKWSKDADAEAWVGEDRLLSQSTRVTMFHRLQNVVQGWKSRGAEDRRRP